MNVRMIDEEELVSNIYDITIMIKFGQKRKGWIKVKLFSIPESQNSCPECVMRKVCHDSPICSEIITQVIIKGYLLPNLQHYRICQV